ncbi:hypothetical protein QN400_11480 [Pseudomonas sp. RTC3]|uniref:hypothetical protein n=1 Tax=Pseudomonas sp. 5C2 TaxID=3048588 RepID=UPI002AB5D414|nr:hypothetical protein [Pseudomonas sp. 5C2]MDY7565486.1 hypothetical protein [Pseudomonas sp. 5C2]MEB0062650.1 hypothetical protein [Pseudomonas sp. RTC3]MEB0239891.1 hypothetical protein [Pseudomonas sp. 5C2]
MNLRSLILALIVALMMALVGCASKNHAPDQTPPVLVSEDTWRQVDWDIVTASLTAKGSAKDYARSSMANWRDLAYQRTEADFIPWFTGYWTQQWLTLKVAWYKVSTGKETDPAKRMANYLQEQYHNRVLDPVAKQIDPGAVMEQTTKLYIQLLGTQLQGIAPRYGVPLDQLDRRFKDIPAIELAPPPNRNASLYQIIHIDPVVKLPAYVALVNQIRNTPSGAGAGPSDASISSVAQRTSEKLEATLPTRGVAGAVAAAVGRVAGTMISLAVSGFGAIAHEKERSEMVEQLRVILSAALDDERRNLMDNPTTGVMAGVYHLSGHIEGSLIKTFTPSVELEPIPQDLPPPGEQPLQDNKSDEQAPSDDGKATE